MKGLLIISTLCILFGHTMSQSNYTCDPMMDCENAGKVGAVVPDPKDCEKFYICIELPDGSISSSAVSVKCAPGYYFDQATTQCLKETVNGTCQNLCLHASENCQTKCPSPFVETILIADKYDCSSFYVCLSDNSTAHARCPFESPYFNGESCVTDPAVCCDFCSLYCSKPGLQIPDPCDCTAFYLCLTEGFPSGASRFTCDSGDYYDEASGTCLPGTCENIFCALCDN